MKTFQLPYLLTDYDWVLGPVYLFLALALAVYFKQKFYKNSPLQKYLVPGLMVCLVGNVAQALIHHFVYPSSDLHNYFSGATEIWNATKENPVYGLELVFKPVQECSAKAQEFASHMAYAYFAPSNRLMFQISGFIGMFCFGTYLPIATVFTCIGYVGLWRIFKCFCDEFPLHKRFIFFTCMVTPSVIMWCSNLQKEPLCMLGLGLCVEALYALTKNRFGYRHLLGVALGAIILLSLKNYIFYSFLGAAVPALYVRFWQSAIKKYYKIASAVAIVLAIVAASVWIYNDSSFVNEQLDDFFTNNVDALQNSQINEGGSTYVIPNVRDFSLLGVLRTYVLSLNVTLFRPYIWEVKNVFALLSGLEVLIVMLFSLYLLFRTGILGFFGFAGKRPLLMFCLMFTLMIGPAAGLIAFNFGTLVRYKLPLVPFFYTYLLLLFMSLSSKTQSANG